MENEEIVEELDFEETQDNFDTRQEDVITLSKKEYNKLNRKAFAYDANKQVPKTQDKASQKDTPMTDDKYVRLELKIDGYSDESIDFVMKNGGKEALQNEYVKTAVSSIQEQKRAENAVVSNDSTKSDVERKFSQEEIMAMSPEELYKILPKARK